MLNNIIQRKVVDKLWLYDYHCCEKVSVRLKAIYVPDYGGSPNQHLYSGGLSGNTRTR